jgi:hypothetical protein
MPSAGDIIDVGDFIVPKFIHKAASESVTSSTTLQDDDDLTVDLPVGTWRVQVWLTATGATGGDIKVSWTNTGTMSVIGRSCLGPNLSTTSNLDGGILLSATTFGASVEYGLSSANHAINEDLLIDVSVAGSIQMRWAQVASSGTATTLSTSSRMYITQVEEN